MKDFMGGLGSSAKVGEALKKHGAPNLATSDMELYDLTDPKVTKVELEGAKTCYTMDAKAGVTTRTYAVCWDGAKIARIEDRGTR